MAKIENHYTKTTKTKTVTYHQKKALLKIDVLFVASI